MTTPPRRSGGASSISYHKHRTRPLQPPGQSQRQGRPPPRHPSSSDGRARRHLRAILFTADGFMGGLPTADRAQDGPTAMRVVEGVGGVTPVCGAKRGFTEAFGER